MPDDTPIIRFRLRKRLLPLYRQIQEAKPGALCGEIFSDFLILYGADYLARLNPLTEAPSPPNPSPLPQYSPQIPVKAQQPHPKQHDATASLSKLRSKLQS